jgi:hypothetical protein
MIAISPERNGKRTAERVRRLTPYNRAVNPGMAGNERIVV